MLALQLLGVTIGTALETKRWRPGLALLTAKIFPESPMLKFAGFLAISVAMCGTAFAGDAAAGKG
jgi:hypothetical protein